MGYVINSYIISFFPVRKSFPENSAPISMHFLTDHHDTLLINQ